MPQDNPDHVVSDVMDPARANALLAMLGRPATLAPGDALPPFFHQIYFWDAQPPARLGRDGHPAVGQGLIPDPGLPRRMWAGGTLGFAAPVVLGQPAEKRSRVVSVTHKTGRSGPLCFVTLQHDIWQDGRCRVTETQDLVYRNDPDPKARAPQPPWPEHRAEDRLERRFTPTDLFRYSALTFNGHRIHYDLDYARNTEGYEGLVVHAPLLVQELLLWAQDIHLPCGQFSFRAVAPVMHGETVTLCRRDTALWVAGRDGRLCLKADTEA